MDIEVNNLTLRRRSIYMDPHVDYRERDYRGIGKYKITYIHVLSAEDRGRDQMGGEE